MIPFIVFPVTLITLFYLWTVLYLRSGLFSLKKSNVPAEYTYSVVIAARNEEDNIAECLSTIVDQTMNNERYEIIIANDRSTDSTAKLIESFVSLHKNMKMVTIEKTPEGISPKKYALSQALKEAKNEIIVFTDADCFVPRTWLETIDQNFFGSIDLVQGITTYRYIPGMNRLFLGLQSVDFLSHGVTAAAGIGVNIPINSNANNFAFKRKAFDKVEGFNSDKGIISADDDMILQKIWDPEKENIQFMTDPGGAVETLPTPTVHEVLEQRKRWGSNTTFYKTTQKVMLGGIFIFYLTIAFSFLISLFSPKYFLMFGGLLVIKFLGELSLMIPGTRIFMKKRLRKYILPATIIHLPLILYAVFFGTFGKFNWKDQEFKKEVNEV